MYDQIDIQKLRFLSNNSAVSFSIDSFTDLVSLYAKETNLSAWFHVQYYFAKQLQYIPILQIED